ncbi:hypothetical protein CIY_27140 [Butyrivibrio fibrisolvens 16/4]|nr:hypothetical protein CIY_27140 [Butyrivibrio fibrisolvens 16/4]
MEKNLSIFSLERQNDLRIEFNKIRNDLSTKVRVDSKQYTIEAYLDVCVKFWPYRCGAISVKDYLNDIGVDTNEITEKSDILLYLELIINLLYWAPIHEASGGSAFSHKMFFGETDIEKESERIIKNIEYVLDECCNMVVQEECAETNKYYIRMKNAQAEVVAATIPELEELVLSYLDMRKEDDVEYKKSILYALYSYMEPRRDEYKKLACSAISEEFFASMNKLGIRHNTKTQVKLNEDEQIEVYDKLYFLALYVLETVKVNGYKDELKDLR